MTRSTHTAHASSRVEPVQELGDDLVLRAAQPDDLQPLVEFNTRIFDERITDWTDDLMSGRHPTVQPGDFTIVEDTRRKRIVSSLCLISQRWAYGGIPFSVGRFELVATDPEYRRRGLIRRQFEVIHRRSLAKGEAMQVITGVDWFYRQFGYEMGIKLWGSYSVDGVRIDRMEQTPHRSCRLRPAGPEDHAFIRHTYERAIRGQLLAALRSPEEWNYEFEGRSLKNTRRREFLIVESNDGERWGYVQYLPCLASQSWPMFRVYQIELRAGIGYLNLAGDVLIALWERARAMLAGGAFSCDALHGLELALERDHPFFQAIPRNMLDPVRPGPWYIRVPDTVTFLRTVASALERHLAGSIAEAFTGELKLNFFHGRHSLEARIGQDNSDRTLVAA